jgi:hypothetical protein
MAHEADFLKTLHILHILHSSKIILRPPVTRRFTMSRTPITKEDAKRSIPRAAILEAITRCESVCNPALIEKRLFSVHVRKLPASGGKGWVVRVINKESINKIAEPLEGHQGGKMSG